MLTILPGDCRETLATLPAESVQCCVTSPPYYGLRDYGVTPIKWPAVNFAPMAGLPNLEIPAMTCSHGLEPDLWSFVGHEVLIFRAVRRVLREDGTLWVNLGDSMANDAKWGGSTGGKHAKALHADTSIGRNRHQTGLPGKNMMGIPWRVAFALQADGWILRSEIIWHKPNPMPESISDRPTKAHEQLFMFSKLARYYYDAEAILEPASPSTHARLSQNVEAQIGSARANGGSKTNGNMRAVARGKSSIGEFGVKNNPSFAGSLCLRVPDRNKRTVWTVPTQSYRGAHFATFPQNLVKPCILAGSRAGDTILDPFGGSGTTGQVAIELGRNAVLCELNPAYCDLIRQRCSITPGLALHHEHPTLALGEEEAA